MGVESVIKFLFNSATSIHTITVSICIQGFWLTAWLNFKNHDIYVERSDKSFAPCILQSPCILMTVLGVNFRLYLSYALIYIDSVILDTGNCDKHVLPADAVCLRCRNLPQVWHGAFGQDSSLADQMLDRFVRDKLSSRSCRICSYATYVHGSCSLFGALSWLGELVLTFAARLLDAPFGESWDCILLLEHQTQNKHRIISVLGHM